MMVQRVKWYFHDEEFRMYVRIRTNWRWRGRSDLPDRSRQRQHLGTVCWWSTVIVWQSSSRMLCRCSRYAASPHLSKVSVHWYSRPRPSVRPSRRCCCCCCCCCWWCDCRGRRTDVTSIVSLQPLVSPRLVVYCQSTTAHTAGIIVVARRSYRVR